MKTIIYPLLLIFPITIFAAESHRMDEKDMQAMMAQMQKMQECMQNIDRSELTAVEQDAKKITTKIKALCDAGEPDKAKQHAITFSTKLMKRPALQELRRCSEMATGAAPMIPLLDQYKPENFEQYDICSQ